MSSTERSRDRLTVASGFCTEQGPRPRNEDYCAVLDGPAARRARHGVVAAVADGVGGAKGGRVAAELAVRTFIDGYLSQSELLPVPRTAGRALEAASNWIYGVGRTDPDLEGMACTFTALILKGRQAHVVHVGDSRLYRLRDDRLDLLTTDHTFSQWGMSGVLSRAVGGGDTVQVQHVVEPAQVHDRYLLCTDGVHGALPDKALRAELALRASPAEAARALVEAAYKGRSTDNATAVVVDVLALAATSQADLELAIAALPVLPAPVSGTVVDGLRLGRMMTDGRYSRVFEAHDTVENRRVVAKFPKSLVGAADGILRQAFLREAWIATRIRSPWVAEIVEMPPGRQTQLYSVMPFYTGATLEERLRREPPLSLAEGLAIAVGLGRGIVALHRAGIVHRDIKPDNVILHEVKEGQAPRPTLLDLGVARVPHMDDFALEHAPGTPSYMAPELFDGAPGDEASDQFALAVTIYRMFSGTYPYGEVEAFSRPRFGRPTPLIQRRSDLPAWLDSVLARALATVPRDRYGDVLEMMFELEQGSVRASTLKVTRQPLYERNPVLVWQMVAFILFVALIVSWVPR